MKFILIKAENNYADEFDVQGFALYRGDNAERALDLISKLGQVPHSSEISFGTNESVRTIDTVFEISELKQDDYYRIISLLGEDYGILNVDWVLECIEEALESAVYVNMFKEYVQGVANKLREKGLNFQQVLKSNELNERTLTIQGNQFIKEPNGWGSKYQLSHEDHYLVLSVEDYVEWFH